MGAGGTGNASPSSGAARTGRGERRLRPGRRGGRQGICRRRMAKRLCLGEREAVFFFFWTRVETAKQNASLVYGPSRRPQCRPFHAPPALAAML